MRKATEEELKVVEAVLHDVCFMLLLGVTAARMGPEYLKSEQNLQTLDTVTQSFVSTSQVRALAEHGE